MPSSTSLSQTDPSLKLAQQLLTYYGYSFMLIFGNIGNILNIILFFRKKLRITSCNNYFLASAFTNLIALNIGIMSLILTEAQPSRITTAYCKIQGYIMSASLQMSRFFILSACFDRYVLCLTNANLRKFCHTRVARRYVIPSIILIWLIIPVHIPIFIIAQNYSCALNEAVGLYNSVYSIVLIGSIPPALMFIFSLLIFRNLKLRQKRRQIHPIILGNANPMMSQNRRLQVKDRQVLAMLLVQVFSYVVSSTPYTIISFYVVLKTDHNTAEFVDDNKSIITFSLFIADMLRFFCPFMSFYLFILVSHLYRNEMKTIILSICRWCHLLRRRQNNIYPNGSMVLTQNSRSIRQIASRQQQKPATVPPSVAVN